MYIHYPGSPLRLPQYLVNKVKLVQISDGVSPQYDDPVLIKALEQFITAFGARYNGHKTVGFIQVGLLGKWGGTFDRRLGRLKCLPMSKKKI
jgi:hypothetical protein